MKKRFLITFFLYLNCCYAQQPFCPAGAVWHYDYWQIGSGGFVRIAYAGDTVIQNINCKKLSAVQYQFFSSSSNIHVTTILNDQYIYQSGDTLFRLDQTGSFLILYNFNAAPGSEWIVNDSLSK